MEMPAMVEKPTTRVVSRGETLGRPGSKAAGGRTLQHCRRGARADRPILVPGTRGRVGARARRLLRRSPRHAVRRRPYAGPDQADEATDHMAAKTTWTTSAGMESHRSGETRAWPKARTPRPKPASRRRRRLSGHGLRRRSEPGNRPDPPAAHALVPELPAYGLGEDGPVGQRPQAPAGQAAWATTVTTMPSTPSPAAADVHRRGGGARHPRGRERPGRRRGRRPRGRRGR